GRLLARGVRPAGSTGPDVAGRRQLGPPPGLPGPRHRRGEWNEMTRRMIARVALLSCLASFGLGPRPTLAQGLAYIKAHYTKHEFKTPMRDGVRLFTSVYVPKDDSKSYPILLNRTPYSVRPYGVDQSKSDLGPHPAFGTSGYIFAYQDVRGRWMSEGVF